MFWDKERPMSQKYRERRKRRARLMLFFSLFGLLAVVGLAFWVGYSDTFRIIGVEITGTTTAKDVLVKDRVLSVVGKKFLFIFPIDNTVLVPKRKIEKILLDEFAQISDVEVKLTDGHSIKIAIKERKAIGVWCAGEINVALGDDGGKLIFDTYREHDTINEEVSAGADDSVPGSRENLEKASCYFLDEFGYIFSTAPDFSGNLFFRYYGGNTADMPVGSGYLPEEVFRERSFFIKSLATLDLNPVAYEWRKNGDSFVYLDPGRDKGLRGFLIFNNKDEPGDVFQNLSLAISHDDFRDMNVTLVDMEYIDLRSPNKIFYKLK